jgi:predicted kinase
MLFVECHAPGATLAQRAARRARAPSRISDADAAVVAREQQSWEPLDEVPAAAHLAVRTDRSGEEVLSDVLALIDQRLLERAPQ